MIEVAEKPVSKSEQIRRYVAANPTATPKQVADALGVTGMYVSQVMWDVKRKAKTKKVTLNPTQRAIAKKSGITAEEYAKGLLTLKKKKPVQLEMFEPKPDPVNHPAHYKVGGIETIDFIEAKKLNYNLGNVVKYLTRAEHKGNRKQDLEKAKWYLERELSTAT
jgi:hypothetical protein